MGNSTYSQIGSPSDVTMLNKGQYSGALSKLNDQMANYSSGMGGFQSQASQALGEIGGLSNNYNNMIRQLMGGYGTQGLTGQLQNLGESYDPNAGLNLFLSQQPQLQGVAESMARNSLSEYGQSAQELANATSQASLGATADQLAQAGLLGAGAGTSAMTRAALEPTLAAQTQLAQTRAGFLQNVGGQLASQGLSQAQSAYDQQQNARLQSILGQMQGVQSAAGVLGNQISGLGAQAQGYSSLGSNLGSLLGQAESAYSSLSQPEYWQPQYAKDRDWVDYLTMILGGASTVAAAAIGGK